MLMMRLQRVGRRNDPSYRILVVDKKTGPKSKNHIDQVGSYSPKLGSIIIDKEKAKKWIDNGVQPSDTVYNMLVTQKVIEGKKRNALGRHTPIIDEAKIKAEAEAKAKAEADAKAKIEADAKAAEDAKAAAEVAPETPAEEVAA